MFKTQKQSNTKTSGRNLLCVSRMSKDRQKKKISVTGGKQMFDGEK
jgi:hypothetical protein